jgi:heterogeneous nuclear ribonucleoprotein G
VGSPLSEEKQFHKFFIGGILYSAKEIEVERYFRQFGEVVDVAIMRDKHSNRSRGFAFVTFRERTRQGVENLHKMLL